MPQTAPRTRHARPRPAAASGAGTPRRVSGPLRPAPAAGAAVRRGTTGVFERIRALPETRFVDRLLRGRAWIWLIGLLLGGIVAMQVSLLKLNAGISRAVTTQRDARAPERRPRGRHRAPVVRRPRARRGAQGGHGVARRRAASSTSPPAASVTRPAPPAACSRRARRLVDHGATAAASRPRRSTVPPATDPAAPVTTDPAAVTTTDPHGHDRRAGRRGPTPRHRRRRARPGVGRCG